MCLACGLSGIDEALNKRSNMARTKKAAVEKYNLVIVESPAKAKTIEKFLGKGVLAG